MICVDVVFIVNTPNELIAIDLSGRGARERGGPGLDGAPLAVFAEPDFTL